MENFATKLEPKDTGCIEWTGGKSAKGYGVIKSDGKLKKVHRLVMERHLGRELSPREFVCHKCDNPPCCNIDHLFVGTVQDNMKDAIQKGRLIGGSSTSRKLSPPQVAELRKLHALGIGCRRLSTIFGITAHAVRLILQGKTYKNV